MSLDVPAGVVDAVGRALAAESARFASLGWMRGTSGNLSVVVRRDPLLLAVTASGLDKGELGRLDHVYVDAAGEPAATPSAHALRPSAEAGLHARIAALTGAGAVVHVHAPAAVQAGWRWPDGVVLRDLEMLKGIGHAAHDETVVVPVVPNDQDMTVLGDALDRAYVLTDGVAEVPALVVADHGLYAWGADLTQARHHAEIVEWLFRFVLDRD